MIHLLFHHELYNYLPMTSDVLLWKRLKTRLTRTYTILAAEMLLAMLHMEKRIEFIKLEDRIKQIASRSSYQGLLSWNTRSSSFDRKFIL